MTFVAFNDVSRQKMMLAFLTQNLPPPIWPSTGQYWPSAQGRASFMPSYLTPEHLQRIALIEAETVKVFCTADKAKVSLSTHNAALGASPLSMLDTDAGVREVRKVLSAIAYGGAA